MKLIKSKFFPYCLLIILGAIYCYLEINNENRQFDEKAYKAHVELLSKELKVSLLQLKQGIFESSVKEYSYRRSVEATYSSIKEYYNALMKDQPTDKFDQLFTVAKYLDSDFKTRYDKNNILGIDSIDVNILYRILTHKYGVRYPGCGVLNPLKVKSKYSQKEEMYITKVVYPITSNRFRLIYQDVSYRLNDEMLTLHIDPKDIEQGYAEIKIRDRISKEEKSFTLELPKYAFKV